VSPLQVNADATNGEAVNRRPTKGETLRVRNGGLVTVGSCGMKYVRCSYIGQATSFLVSLKDLCIVEDSEPLKAVVKKQSQRPAMDALDQEFLGDLEGKENN
jgi:hypothetical protein